MLTLRHHTPVYYTIMMPVLTTDRSCEKVAELKYLGTVVTNQKWTHNNIKGDSIQKMLPITQLESFVLTSNII